MNVSENTSSQKLEELKKENTKLKQELSQVYASQYYYSVKDLKNKIYELNPAEPEKSEEPEKNSSTFAFHIKRKRIAQFLILMVFVLSFLNIVGWTYNIPFFKGFQEDWLTIRIITIISFIISSLAVTLLQTRITMKLKNTLVRIMGAIVTLIAVITVLSYLLDLTIITTNVSVIRSFLSGETKMAMLTAILFTGVGLTIITLTIDHPKAHGIAHALIIPILIVSYFVPVSYLLGITSLFATYQFPVALYSGINFCLLCISIFIFYPNTWFMKTFVEQFAGGGLARRLVPGIIVIPFIIGWLRINGERAGFFNSETGVVLITVAYTFCFLVLVWFSAKRVIKIDKIQRTLDASLRKSEEQYRLLVETANCIIARYDNQGTIKFMNDYGLLFFGYTREEIIGKNVNTIIANKETTGGDLSELIKDMFSNPQNYLQFENENIRKNGERVWVSWANRTIPDEHGNNSEILAIGNDFTDRKNMELKLIDQTHFVTTVTETVPDIISIVELPSRKPVYTNKEPFSFSGFRLDDVIKMSPEQRQQLIHPDDLSSFFSYFDKFSSLKDNQTIALEYRVKSTEGAWTWLRARGKVFERDVQGKVKSCINVVQNINQEKGAEIKLQESETRFRTLADNISQFVWIADEHGKFQWFNKRWLDYTGLTLEEMQDSGKFTLIAPEYSEKVLNNFQQAIEKGEPWVDIYPMRRRDGEFRWFLNQAIPVQDQNGKVVQWFGTNTDIHEQKLAEDKAKALATEMEAILACIPAGVLVYDTLGKIVRSNSAANKLLDYPDEATSMSVAERVSKLVEVFAEDGHKLSIDEVPAYKAAVKAESVSNQILLIKRETKAVWMSFSASPLVISGKHTGAVISMMDIDKIKKAEEVVRESEERLRLAVESANLGTWDLDLVHDIATRSLRHDQIWGYNELQKKWGLEEAMRHVVPEDHQMIMEAYDRGIKSGLLSHENRVIWPDNTIHWIRAYGRFYYNPDKKPVRVMGIVEDITERKNAEMALRKREQEIRSITDNSPDVIARFDRQFKHTFINPYGEKVYNKSRKDIIGKSNADLDMPSDKVAFWKKHFEDVFASGKQQNVEFEFESPAIGTQYFMSVFVPEKNEKGETVSILAITRDITKIKRTEEKLRENEVILDSFFNNTPVAMIIYSDDNRYVRLNKLAADQYGIPVQEALGKSVFDVLPGDLAKMTEKRNKEVLTLNKPVNLGVYSAMLPLHNNKAKATYWQGFRFPISLPGGKKGVGLVTLEITDRIEAESERKTALEKLQESERKYRELFTSMNEASALVKLIRDDNGKIIDYTFLEVNPVWEQMAGISKENATGKSAKELFHTVEDYWLDVFDQVAVSGEPVHIEEYSGGMGRYYAVNIWKVGEDQCAHTFTDITERKQAELKIRESEERFRTLADNMSQIAWTADKDGKLTWLNKQWYDYTGLTVAEMQKEERQKVYGNSELFRENYAKSVQKGEPWEIILSLKSKTGESRWFLTRAVPIRDEKGNITQWFGTNTDIHEQKLAEEKAKTLATELEAILSCIPDGVIVYDGFCNILRINSAANDLLQYPEHSETLPYRERMEKLLDLRTEKGRKLKPEEMPAYKAAALGETVLNEVLLLKRDDQSKWINFSAAPLFISGKHAGGVISMSDITPRKEAEERLKESQQRFKGVFDNAGIGISEVNEEDRFISVNNRLCEILGYSGGELLGKSVYEITAPEDREHSKEINTKIHNRELDVFDYEKRYIRKDGSYVWVHASLSAVRSEKGQLVRTIRTIEDVSARKVAEEALKESEEMFSTMINVLPIGVTLSSYPDRKIYKANPAWLKILGYSKEEEVYGKSSEELGIIRDIENQKHYLEEFRIKGNIRNVQTTIFTKTGVQRTASINLDPVYIKGQKYTLATVEDITIQKSMEQELTHKNEELTRFIYTVSHDLKSPLVTIKSFTKYLEEDIETKNKEAQDSDLRYINNAADKMGKLLDELLELSRIGRKEDPKTEVPMKTVAQAAVDLVAGRISQRNVKVNITGPDVMLYGHYPRLLQLYQNLLDNAVKFMGNQTDPLIEIGSIKDDKKHQVILFVRDNGSGIDPKFHHKVFGLFEKLDTKAEGTGIGLALIKRIVEVHNGSIWFQSEGEGKGTTFYFTFEKTYIINQGK